MPFAASTSSSISVWPGVLARRLGEDQVGGVGVDLRASATRPSTRRRRAGSGPRRSRSIVRGHSVLAATPASRSSSASAEREQAHAVLRQRVGGVGAEPAAASRFSGGESVRMWPLSERSEVRDRRLGEQERAAHVDVLHQVVALRSAARSSVRSIALALLTTDVDAAERRRAPASRRTPPSSRTSPTIGSALPPAASISLRRGVDRALELRVRLVGLGQQGDVGAVAGGAQRRSRGRCRGCRRT